MGYRTHQNTALRLVKQKRKFITQTIKFARYKFSMNDGYYIYIRFESRCIS